MRNAPLEQSRLHAPYVFEGTQVHLANFLQERTGNLEIQSKYGNHSPQKREPVRRSIVRGPRFAIVPLGLDRAGLFFTKDKPVSSSERATSAVLRVLFVCTGNTCRSPMAEAIFRKLVAEKLICRDWELRERGIDVFSAGIAASESDPASRESVQIMQECGLDLSQHLSQQVSSHMLEESTLVLTMTERHRRALCEVRPDLSDRIKLLRRDREDISDPMGGSLDDYRVCSTQIIENIGNWVDELFRKDSESL